METKRLYFADVFKFFAMIGVLVAHLPRNGRFSADTWQIVMFAQELLGWCVLGFFAVSGILGSKSPPLLCWSYAKRRSQRLLIPYVAFSILYKTVLTGLTLIGLVKTFPLPDGSWPSIASWLTVPADPQLYFVLYLFVIQLVYIFLFRNSAAVTIICLVSCAAWVAISLLSSPYEGNLYGPNLRLVPLYVAFYSAGTIAASSPAALICSTALFGLLAVVSLACGGSAVQAWQLCAPFALLLLLHALSPSRLFLGLASLGARSGGVYVWHAPLLIAGISLLCVPLLGNGMAGVCVTVILTYVVADLIGAWINRSGFLKWFHM